MRYQYLPLESQGNLTPNISMGRRIHPVWANWKLSMEIHPELVSIRGHAPIIGQYQYIYTSKKGRISLVELPNYFLDGIDLWEICGGGFTEDVEKFASKQEAEVRIKELLE